jgi:hypothetical protein
MAGLTNWSLKTDRERERERVDKENEGGGREIIHISL